MTRVAYLMSHYPAVSHAFVLREVQALRAVGVDVETLSIHPARAADLLSESDRAEAAQTFNVLPAGPGTLLAAHAEAFVRGPARYLAALALAMHVGAPGLRERLWHLFYFVEAIVLLRHVRRRRITHIHAQFADGATDVAMLVSEYRRGATSWSLAVHGSVEFYNVIRYGLEQKLAHARFAVAISDFGRSQLMTLSDTARWPHIHVVRCGVDPEIFRAPDRGRDGTGRTEILFVGRLLHGKGLSLLFASVAELVAEGFELTVRIVGDGPERRKLEAEVRRLRLDDRVRFEGAAGQDDIRSFYERADIFCLPSFAEGIPVVAIEAMATELPVITTQIMGIPELVENGVEGLLVPPGKVDALTGALRRLVCTPELRRKMGAAGRAKVYAMYDVRRSAATMRSVLEQEIALPPGGIGGTR